MLAWLLMGVAQISSAADFSAENENGQTLYYDLLPASPDSVAVVKDASYSDFTEVSIPGEITVDGKTYIVKEVGEYAFQYCGNITRVNISENIRILRKYAFWDNNFNEITLPNSLIEIESAALNSNSLEFLRIPKNLAVIGGMYVGRNFNGYLGGLKKFEVDPENKKFTTRNGILYSKDMTRLWAVPQGYTFNNGTFVIPQEMTSMAYDAIYNISSIKNIIFPPQFDGAIYVELCQNLKSLRIPDKAYIGSLHNNPSLKSVHLGNDYLLWSPWGGCTSLEEVTVSESNENITAVDNVLYSKDMTQLIAFPPGIGGIFNIPSSVKAIKHNAFISCFKLKDIFIPESVTTIADYGLDNGSLSGNVTNVHLSATNPEAINLGGNAISLNHLNIIVPEEALDAYLHSSQWAPYSSIISDGRNLFDIPTEVTVTPGKTVYIPVVLNNTDDIIGAQFDIKYDYAGYESKNGKLAVKAGERIAETHIVSVSDPKFDNLRSTHRVVIASMQNDSFEGNEGPLIYIPLSINEYYNYVNAGIRIDNIILSKRGNIKVTVPHVGCNVTMQRYNPGDVDNDNEITVTDITKTITYINDINGTSQDSFNFDAADMDKDGAITVVDVTSIVSLVLSGTNEAVSTSETICRADNDDPAGQPTTYFSCNDVEGIAGSTATLEISMTNDIPVIGFQCDITLPENVTVAKNDRGRLLFTLDDDRKDDHFISSAQTGDNSYRLVVISMTNALFPGDSGVLFTCPLELNAQPGEYDIKLSRIILSKEGNVRVDLPDCQSALTILPDNTGVITIRTDETKSAQYYDLHGLKVENPSNGLFIKVENGTSSKVFIP